MNMRNKVSAIIAAGLTVTGLAVAPAHAAPVPAGLLGTWTGAVTWSDGAGPRPTTLTVTRAKPLRAEIAVIGTCTGTWTETGRSANTLSVRYAHVRGASCLSTNTWRLTFPSATRITGVTNDFGAPGSISLTKVA